MFNGARHMTGAMAWESIHVVRGGAGGVSHSCFALNSDRCVWMSRKQPRFADLDIARGGTIYRRTLQSQALTGVGALTIPLVPNPSLGDRKSDRSSFVLISGNIRPTYCPATKRPRGAMASHISTYSWI